MEEKNSLEPLCNNSNKSSCKKVASDEESAMLQTKMYTSVAASFM